MTSSPSFRVIGVLESALTISNLSNMTDVIAMLFGLPIHLLYLILSSPQFSHHNKRRFKDFSSIPKPGQSNTQLEHWSLQSKSKIPASTGKEYPLPPH
jgi:hypothetical protein